MKNIIKKHIRGLLLVPVLALAVGFIFSAPPQTAYATPAPTPLTIDEGVNSTTADADRKCVFADGSGAECADGENLFTTVTNVLLFIIGAISVIMLIIGGVRYTVSGGDSAAVTSAKNTILYAIVGIIIAILAFAIVNFIAGSFGAGATA